MPGPVLEEVEGAQVGIISLGSNHDGVDEARARLAATGLSTNYLRLRALPIEESVRSFIEENETIFVVEANSDGQLHAILTTEEPAHALKLNSMAKCDGLPLSARYIVEQIQEALEEELI